MRTFRVHTESSLSDPCWIVALEELLPNGEVVRYTDLSPLKDVIREVDAKWDAYKAEHSQT